MKVPILKTGLQEFRKAQTLQFQSLATIGEKTAFISKIWGYHIPKIMVKQYGQK
jgi:hypothetical protein